MQTLPTYQFSVVQIPSWLASGPVPVILAIVVAIVVILLYVNYKIKAIQKNLHSLGKSYYEKEKIIIDRYKSGLMTDKEYRHEHERLLREMREDSRRITDGPPR
ncbi:MAG TPA: hypothetical protein ENN67_06465 [Firmicutes bacterium]|nr:hypothetical protein [Bacillota bacterium]